jgi:hypothetical protein
MTGSKVILAEQELSITGPQGVQRQRHGELQGIEIFHNRRRRHSKLGYLSPVQFEIASEIPLIPASASQSSG